MKPRRTLWRFAVVGAVNTFVGLAFIYIARAMGLGEITANATGYAVGLVLSFGLNRFWTFQRRGSLLPHILKFSLAMLLAWLANIAVLLHLMRLGVTPVLAQASAVLPYALVSYLGCRWWVFANRFKSEVGT